MLQRAEIPDVLLALGPSLIEVGGITPLPQAGNPRPRVFRLPSQSALINRYGLNSDGADAAARVLRQRIRESAYKNGLGIDASAEEAVLGGDAGVPRGSLAEGKLLAIQVAKNAKTDGGDVEAVVRDYVYCVERLAKYADVITINVCVESGYSPSRHIEANAVVITGPHPTRRISDPRTFCERVCAG